MLVKSGYHDYSIVEDLHLKTVKLDSTTSPSRKSVTGHLSYNDEYFRACFSCWNARSGDYTSKDSIQVWVRAGKKSAYLYKINPTKEALKVRAKKKIFLIGGMMIYPFMILLFFYLRQVYLERHVLQGK